MQTPMTATTSPVSPAIQPYAWLALDIETADGRPESADRWMRECWSPNPSWGETTIGRRFKEMHAKKLERLALLNEAPIKVVAMRSDSEVRCLHWLHAHEPRELHGALVEGFVDQRAMLAALKGLFDVKVAPDTLIVGHNTRAFDLPKLRWAYVHDRVQLPAALANRDQPVYDTMVEYTRHFSLDKGIMVALPTVLDALDLPNHKSVVTGAQVPELIAKGEFDAIVQYAILDVLAESRLFLLMVGEDDKGQIDGTSTDH